MIKESIVISIVVPIYKVENYLEKCIISLLNQTYKHIEIILVDDGSPDECPKICDDYAKKDSRVKVIHKLNGGLSDARNIGLIQAKGEYVLFVDSDDYIELDTCEKFVEIVRTQEVDLVVGNAKRLEGNQIIMMKHKFINSTNVITGEQYLKEELKTGSMYMAAWLTLYNRRFLLDNNFKFKVGLLHEDEEFTPRVFLKAEKVISTDIIFYNYVIREESITTGKNRVKNAQHIIQTCYELSKIYNNLTDVELKNLLNDSLAAKYLNAFQMGKLYKREYKGLVDKIFISKLAYRKKTKIKVKLFCINYILYYKINYIIKNINRRYI